MTSPQHVAPIQDPGVRILRTLIQVGIPSFLTLAAGFPAVAAQLGVFLSPRMQTALLGLAAAITAAATGLSWLMSVPAVNLLLGKLGLAGHSGTPVEIDSLTRAFSVPAGVADAYAGH